MNQAPLPQSPPLLAERQRTGRAAAIGLLLLATVTLLGPLFSWRAEIELVRTEMSQRLWQQARLESSALAWHLALLEAELRRVAEVARLDPLEGLSEQEVALLEVALGGSPLFEGGVVVLDASGTSLWTDPARPLSLPEPLTTRPWFQRMQQAQPPSASVEHLANGDEGRLAVVVPVVREGALRGALVGAMRRDLPGSQGLNGRVILFDRDGEPLWSVSAEGAQDDELAHLERAEGLFAALQQPDGASVRGRSLLAAITPVADHGLQLALVVDEGRALEDLRTRFLVQLAFHSLVLLAALGVFALFLRRAYRALLAAEQRLRHQETVAALGAASQLIAHEVKNALNGIQAALSALRGSPAAQALPVTAMRAQVVRLSNLARSLLSFGAPRAASWRRILELHLVVEEALQSVRLLPESSDVALEIDLQQDVHVHADPALLESAIDNLIRNAVEAAAVARDTGMRESPWVRVTLRATGGRALITVEDDAGGVDPQLEPRLWEPFATARAKGIGLGLPLARKAVEDHGGTLEFIRTPMGSRFALELPTTSAGGGETP
ncbi:MAG TPA: ATP-binding protein [Myxococcaceae bacterium]|nr:ATP-binding protein [Myxococcaceae bacterium]